MTRGCPLFYPADPPRIIRLHWAGITELCDIKWCVTLSGVDMCTIG